MARQMSKKRISLGVGIFKEPKNPVKKPVKKVATKKTAKQVSNIKKGAKRKGRSYEFKIARLLAKWIGDEKCLWHTHQSGALKHLGKTQEGDICPQAGYHFSRWPFSIEAKKQENWSFDAHMKNLFISKKLSPIDKYWEQCVSDCGEGKFPLLVFSKARSLDYLLMRVEDFNIIMKSRRARIQKTAFKSKAAKGVLVLMTLQDFITHTHARKTWHIKLLCTAKN